MASFALLIVLGTVGLRILPGLYTGDRLSWLDALFTATSAVCVTGLIVEDTAVYFTFAGQAFVLLLIQLGGLGMLSFASVIIVAFGRRMSLRHEALHTSSLDVAPHVDTRRLAFDVVIFTFAIEVAGALLLFLLWLPRYDFLDALWHAVFHSISAFCNAGFSTFSDSLIGFDRAPFTQLVIMLLIVAGGLGFLTMEEVYLRYRAGRTKRIFRVSLHSKLVLATTAALVALGWLLFLIFEWNVTLAELPLGHRIVNALFMSVTPRTAGFNTIDYARTSESASFLTIILMMIGGSPGSTAGGIKTTTFALIGLLAWSRLRGYEITRFGGRSVREETTDRAIGLFAIAFGLVTAGIFVLTASEGFGVPGSRFLSWMFEAASAFNTVGLSMGVTPELSAAGRWTTILLMFFGRVGPLTIAAALATRRPGERGFRYAYEDVVVG
ncbi:MAG TPA: TrkH family potassium uptake protein [Pirellulales bacterium]|nr:TrkH family potassium uptake protein [Pirellulales bacterium]